MQIVVLNAGGASHIAMSYAVESPAPLDPPEPRWRVEVERDGSTFADLFARAPGEEPDVVVHRVVHPGTDPAIPDTAFLDDAIRRAIDDGERFAPRHNALAREGIDAAIERYPRARQCVAFDRAFRSDAPLVATTLAGPKRWRDRGLRRIGFHGISHHDAIERVQRALGRDDARVATVHLGSGCSVSAFAGSRLVDTTMSLTPLDGLVMGTRAGSLDPGLLLHLLKGGVTPDALEKTLYGECGLLGLSERSLDTRDVYAAADAGDANARLALDVYCYRLRTEIGSVAATLGGLDAVSWSGPVGEHMPRIRATVSGALAFLGIALDDARNAALAVEGSVPFADVSSDAAAVRTFVVPTLEEWAMCRRVAALDT